MDEYPQIFFFRKLGDYWAFLFCSLSTYRSSNFEKQNLLLFVLLSYKVPYSYRSSKAIAKSKVKLIPQFFKTLFYLRIFIPWIHSMHHFKHRWLYNVYLSIQPSIYLSIYPAIYLSIFLGIYLFIHLTPTIYLTKTSITFIFLSFYAL